MRSAVKRRRGVGAKWFLVAVVNGTNKELSLCGFSKIPGVNGSGVRLVTANNRHTSYNENHFDTRVLSTRTASNAARGHKISNNNRSVGADETLTFLSLEEPLIVLLSFWQNHQLLISKIAKKN